MMRNQKLKSSHHIAVFFFILAILSQNAIESPLLCIENDGHVNIEAGCENNCTVPKSNEHQDTCDDCIDIQLWNYNPDIAFLVKSIDCDFIVNRINSSYFFHQNFSHLSFIFLSTENPNGNSPLLLKNTILLI